MLYLILGLVLFLGIHSTRIFADPWRTRQIERFGKNGWKGIYTLISLAGFVLIIWGYGEAPTPRIPLLAMRTTTLTPTERISSLGSGNSA